MPTNNKIILGITGAIVIIVLIFGIKASLKPPTDISATTTLVNTPATGSGLPGIQISLTPWAPEISHLSQRLATIGLPALAQEGTALHIHQHLNIIIHGQAVAVPAEIGINQFAGFISPIHVHDTSGVIHVESPTIQKFTLGQFFDIWGVRFTQDAIGGYSTDANLSMQVYVNGKKVDGAFRDIELTAHQEIAIVFGTVQEAPKDIPATYNFGSL